MTDVLFDEHGVGRCLVAPDGSVLRANAEWLRSNGLSLEDVLGEDIVDLFPQTRESALALCARARTGSRVEIPPHARFVNGRETWWKGSIEPVSMEGGTGLLLSAREVVPRERGPADEALRQSGATLDAALASMTDAVLISDAEGRCIHCNDAFAALHRFPTKEACAKALAGYPAWLDVYFPDGTPAPVPTWAVPRALRGETAVNAEYALRRKDTGDRWIASYSFAPIRDPGGRVVGSVVVGRDVTAQKRTEEALKARDAQFRVLIEEVYSGVALVDATGKFTLYNRRFLEMFGLSSDADVENVNSQDWGAWQVSDEKGRLLHVDDHPVRKAALKRERVRNQLVGVRLPSGGAPRWMLVSAEPLLAKDGTVEQLICTYHDITDRKRVEERERRLASIIENGNVPFGMAAPDGGILLFNRAFEQLTGYTREEIEAGAITWVADLTPPEWREKEAEALAQAVASRKPIRYEKEYRRKDGARVPVELVVQPVFAEDGSVAHYWSFLTDITERKRTEAALRESEQALRASEEKFFKAFHGSASAMSITRLRDGRFIEVNQQFLDVMGFSREQVLGETSTRLRVWRSPEERDGFVRRLREHGFVRDEEHVLLRANGEEWTALVSSQVSTLDGEEVLINSSWDITERKRAEQALRDSEAQLRAFVQSDVVGILFGDVDGRVRDCNEEFARIIGRPREDVLAGKVRWTDITTPEDQPLDDAALAEARATGRCRPYEKRYVLPDGTRVPTQVGYVLLEPDRTRSVAFVLDITERKAAEEGLRSSRRELRALAARQDTVREEEKARIARELHDDLGQILTALRLDVESLERGLEARPLEGPIPTLLDTAVDASELAAQATQALQRVVSALRPAALDRLGLCPALREECRNFERRTGIRCRAQVPEDVLGVGAGTDIALFRIAQEALTNVARHSRATQVVVSVELDDEAIRLRVEDDGRGIEMGAIEPRSLGIVGMRERAGRLGGALTVARGEHGGTAVCARIPVEPACSADVTRPTTRS